MEKIRMLMMKHLSKPSQERILSFNRALLFKIWYEISQIIIIYILVMDSLKEEMKIFQNLSKLFI
jgi:hypothetical protein